jgi:hypothetical protein
MGPSCKGRPKCAKRPKFSKPFRESLDFLYQLLTSCEIQCFRAPLD